MRRLFVSPHTLFVGTMNEDESTQMLSDKVIDRSNVLRFGLPKVMIDPDGTNRKQPDKGSFMKFWADKKRIAVADWDKWCRPIEAKNNSEELSFLRDTVLPVLLAMNEVDRAYGIRVDDAMKMYVLNYPGDYRSAVADQIEMKILPKLNGLEFQNPKFDGIKRAMTEAIDKTNDNDLIRAFEASCKEDATFFKWRGVMR